MIIERKQNGPISILLVQIGLALYVIVVFFAQGADGEINPKILKVQKVAEAKQSKHLKLENINYSSNIQLLGSGQSATQTIESNKSAPILSSEQIIALLEAPKAEILPPTVELEISVDTEVPFLKSLSDIQTIGSKPRAPSFA